MKKALIILTACVSLTNHAQEEISYDVQSNRAKSWLLELYVNPFVIKGTNMGPGVSVKSRLAKRLSLEANLFSAMYLNDYRSNTDDIPNPNSFKKLGGLYFDASAKFVWRKKKIKDVGGKFILGQSSTSTTYTRITKTSYLPFDYNSIVERSICGGVYYDEYPVSRNTQRGYGVKIGLEKRRIKSANLNIDGKDLKQHYEVYYSVNTYLGVPTYLDPNDPEGSFLGLGLNLGTTIYRTKTKEMRGWHKMDFDFEATIKPGGVGYIGASVKVPILRLQDRFIVGKGEEYKVKKESNSKLVRLISRL